MEGKATRVGASELGSERVSMELTGLATWNTWHRLRPDKLPAEAIISLVSASEIIKELPKLSEAERRAVREELLEIANQDPDVALCNQATLEGALMLDRMENQYT